MVLRYRDIVEEEVYWYTHDEGVAEVLGRRNQDAYDQIEDDVKDQLYNEDMYRYLLDIAKKEKNEGKAKEKVAEELKKMVLEAERELTRENIL